jgi:predicted  nucleic acid-binding Zn-ribbon protein
MAIDMKRWNNYDKRDADRERLESVVSSPKINKRKKDCVYDTSLGVFIIYSPTKLIVELYEKDLEGNVQRNTSSIATLTSNLEQANANISTNAGKITNLTNELGVVNGKVETNSQSILDLNSDIDNAQSTLSAHTSSISTLNDKVSGLESTTSTNSQSILQLTTDLQQANADIQTTHSEITGLQSSIDGKLNTSDFWTTLGYNSEEEFRQAISESGLTQEQIDALRNLTDGEYLSTDSFLELISDEDFASSEIGSRLLEITKNNIDDQTIIDVVTSESTLSTLATAVGASSELTNKFATIQSVEDLSDDLATETTNRTEAISSLQQTVNDKISSAEL